MKTRFKSILFCLLLPLGGNTAVADTDAASLCALVAEFADVMMDLRQQGLDQATAMSIAGGDALMQAIVTRAWEHPVLRSPAARAAARAEFHDDWLLRCRRAAN